MKTQHGGKRYGFFSGALWGLDTVVLAIALAMIPFADFGQSALVGAVLHDVACAVILLVYMAIRGRLKDTWNGLRTRPGMSVVVAALLGGPIGMSGYLIAIDNIGPGLTAIISTFYPALGTLLAFALLKERMAPRQIVALLVALGAIVVTGLSATSDPVKDGNAILGIIGALACVIGWGSEAVILTWGMRDEAVDNEVALQIRETTSAEAFTSRLLANLGIPVVAMSMIEANPTGSESSLIRIDEGAGVQQVLSDCALIDPSTGMGTGRAVFLAGPNTNHARQHPIAHAFGTNFTLYSLPDWEASTAYQASVRLLTEDPSISLIALADDSQAPGVFQAADDLGLSVPTDLSILGFGNQDHRNAEAMGLTTVDWPLKEMTEAAVASIINVIEGRPPADNIHPRALTVTEETTPASSQPIPVATIPTHPVWRTSVARRA